MSYLYIDDSVHDKAGFIIAACVYFPHDPTERVEAIIKDNGFDPSDFEFKSCLSYANEPNRISVRENLKALLSTCRLCVVVIPRASRELLGIECLKTIKQILECNNDIERPLSVYLDQGLFNSKPKTESLIASYNFEGCTIFIEQNSKEIKGIQLADLAAHTASIHLKDRMGLISKNIKAGENSGYDPETEISLGFEMWASLRYSFFNEGSKIATDDPIKDATLNVEPYGLYVSGLCDTNLAEVARSAFAEVYLGCIH